jgi:glutamate formiminotransferase/formiminotetrahydrofolate cyclodeaminase
VTGSELVGMIPLEAMLMAGRYYLEQEDRPSDSPEAELVEAAVSSMGLSALMPFEPEERIIEYRLLQGGGRWAEWADRLITRCRLPADPAESGYG